jgi:hypothetical protein
MVLLLFITPEDINSCLGVTVFSDIVEGVPEDLLCLNTDVMACEVH